MLFGYKKIKVNKKGEGEKGRGNVWYLKHWTDMLQVGGTEERRLSMAHSFH